MTFQGTIQIGVYFQYTVYIVKLVVAHNSLRLYSSDWPVEKSTRIANLYANLC